MRCDVKNKSLSIECLLSEESFALPMKKVGGKKYSNSLFSLSKTVNCVIPFVNWSHGKGKPWEPVLQRRKGDCKNLVKLKVWRCTFPFERGPHQSVEPRAVYIPTYRLKGNNLEGKIWQGQAQTRSVRVWQTQILLTFLSVHSLM